MVSNGAEVVMIRKDVFLRNADTRVRNNIRNLFHPYPETEAMQAKLQNKADWMHFKKNIREDVQIDNKNNKNTPRSNHDHHSDHHTKSHNNKSNHSHGHNNDKTKKIQKMSMSLVSPRHDGLKAK